MRISFDLDDTLICYDPTVPREPNRVPFLVRRWFEEPLRLGARQLLRELREGGHEIWIYTSSLRNPRAVKRWLGFYGIAVSRVLNAEIHQKVVRRRQNERFYSKYPPSFGIDLHVDDEDILGDVFPLPFRTLVIAPCDENWTQKVRDAVAYG